MLTSVATLRQAINQLQANQQAQAEKISELEQNQKRQMAFNTAVVNEIQQFKTQPQAKFYGFVCPTRKKQLN